MSKEDSRYVMIAEQIKEQNRILKDIKNILESHFKSLILFEEVSNERELKQKDGR